MPPLLYLLPHGYPPPAEPFPWPLLRFFTAIHEPLPDRSWLLLRIDVAGDADDDHNYLLVCRDQEVPWGHSAPCAALSWPRTTPACAVLSRPSPCFWSSPASKASRSTSTAASPRGRHGRGALREHGAAGVSAVRRSRAPPPRRWPNGTGLSVCCSSPPRPRGVAVVLAHEVRLAATGARARRGAQLPGGVPPRRVDAGGAAPPRGGGRLVSPCSATGFGGRWKAIPLCCPTRRLRRPRLRPQWQRAAS